MLTKAAGIEVDYVFLDLEDAVAPSAKPGARGQIVAALNGLDWGRKTRCVRINDLETQYAYEDVIEVVEGAGANLDIIMVPKVKSAADVKGIDILLSQIEKKLGLEKRIGVEVLIEEVEALMRVEEIAAASDRLEALIFGMGDYSASRASTVPRSAATADIPVISGITRATRSWSQRGLTARTRWMGPLLPSATPFITDWNASGHRSLGLLGSGRSIPPKSTSLRMPFPPGQDAVDRAYKGRDAYLAAQAEGLGAVQVDGAMVDVATVRLLQITIDRAEAVGMKPSWEDA